MNYRHLPQRRRWGAGSPPAWFRRAGMLCGLPEGSGQHSRTHSYTQQSVQADADLAGRNDRSMVGVDAATKSSGPSSGWRTTVPSLLVTTGGPIFSTAPSPPQRSGSGSDSDPPDRTQASLGGSCVDPGSVAKAHALKGSRPQKPWAVSARRQVSGVGLTERSQSGEGQ